MSSMHLSKLGQSESTDHLQHLLEAEVHELQPKPGKQQHEHHVGKSKTKPAGKVDHVTIFREEPEQRERKTERCERQYRTLL